MMTKERLVRSTLLRYAGFLIILGATLYTGCIQLQTPPAPAPSTTAATPSPTVLFPTLIPTPTITPVPTGSPTPDLSAGLGGEFFRDDFSADLGWIPAELAAGGISLSNERLFLSVRQANSLYMAISPADPVTNAFIEVEVRPEICSANDEFGIAFRIAEDFEHYRFTITCQGEARVIGVVEGVERVLLPNSPESAIFPGLFLSNRLGLFIEEDQFRFFINGEEVFSDRDPSLSTGRVGLVVRARQSGQTTASFDNFVIRLLQPTPSTISTG
jgi:hypothetical protein